MINAIFRKSNNRRTPILGDLVALVDARDKRDRGVKDTPQLLAIALPSPRQVATGTTCNQIHNKNTAQRFKISKECLYMYTTAINLPILPILLNSNLPKPPNRTAEFGNDRAMTFFTCVGAFLVLGYTNALRHCMSSDLPRRLS